MTIVSISGGNKCIGEMLNLMYSYVMIPESQHPWIYDTQPCMYRSRYPVIVMYNNIKDASIKCVRKRIKKKTYN